MKALKNGMKKIKKMPDINVSFLKNISIYVFHHCTNMNCFQHSY